VTTGTFPIPIGRGATSANSTQGFSYGIAESARHSSATVVAVPDSVPIQEDAVDLASASAALADPYRISWHEVRAKYGP